MYSAYQSPAIASAPSTYTAPRQDPFTLDATDDSKSVGSFYCRMSTEYRILVRVYDARGVVFNMKTDLDRLHLLPKWQGGEIPEDSCIAVAYTLSSYKGKRGESVSFNLQWIIVYGTP